MSIPGKELHRHPQQADADGRLDHLEWQTKAETAGTTINADDLAIAVLPLGATPTARRRYMALAG
jgi:hypothetical protein